MKILFIGKKTSKPKSVSLTFAAFIILILFSSGIYIVDNFFIYKELNSNIKLNDFELTSNNYNSKDNLDVYVNQIGELYSRILDIDQQTDRLQDVMKKQILGK